jgi:hypothetical protein
VSSRFTADFLAGSRFRRPEVGSEQVLFPRYPPRVYTRLREKAPAEKIRIGTIHLPSKRAYTPLWLHSWPSTTVSLELG